MARAVLFDEYGDIDVLRVGEVEVREPGPGEARVRVRAAGINPGEAIVRSGAFDHVFPATFPSGQGSDLAGVVESVGTGVTTPAVGDEVVGFTDERASQAEYVTVPADQLVALPSSVPFEVAGGLYVAGAAAVSSIRAVAPTAGETVLVSGAAGGVGTIAVQLAVRAGARVIGVASPSNHEFLRALGAEPVGHGDGLADRVRALAPAGVDAVIDLFGGGYVALGLELGVPADRINTIIDFAAVEEHGVRGRGTSDAGGASAIAELVTLLDRGELQVPVAATYPLDEVRAAYTELERRHTRGKIVLLP